MSQIGVAKLPGRVTIIGGHTGDNNGLVISIAIPLYLEVEIEKSTEACLMVESDAFPGKRAIDSLARIEPHWVKYVVGALLSAGFSEREILQLSVRVTSQLPMQKGLASSAALVCATLLAANGGLAKRSRHELLTMCANVERNFVGVNCGILDYYTNLFAVRGQLLYVDCQNQTHETIPWPSDITLLVCDTGKPRQLVNSEYSSRRAQCKAIAVAAGRKSLRDVSQAEVDRLREQYPVEARRADHVLAENDRVAQFVRELQSRNYPAVKNLMAAAHHSLAVSYECSSFEQDLLVDEANKHDCCIGSRLTGAGWGGVTIHLVRKGHEQHLATELRDNYQMTTGVGLQTYLISDPAGGWISEGNKTGCRSNFESQGNYEREAVA